MIKKNTKIIFEGNNKNNSTKLIGGIPLSKGEVVNVHNNGKVIKYIVHKKEIDCFMDKPDQEVNITYRLRKK
jgi:hypothetical protein